MRSRSSLLVGATVFLLIGLVFVWSSLLSAQAARASLKSLEKKLVRLNVTLSQERERLAAGKQQVADLDPRNKKAKSPKAAAAKKTPSLNDPETLMASNPPLRALYLKSFRASLARRYGSIYRKLGLTQAQIDQFGELATAQADDLVTIHSAALAQGLKLSDSGVTALEKQSESQFYERVGNEVGAPMVQQLVELDRISWMQHMANLTEVSNPAGSPPLTGEQETQLKQILANASASYQAGGKADPDSVNWDLVYNQADALLSGVLTASQLQGFKLAIEYQQISVRRSQYWQQNGLH